MLEITPDSLYIGEPVASGTVGSPLFVGTSGLLQQDNTNFFYDDTNNNLRLRQLTFTSVTETSAFAYIDIPTTTTLTLNVTDTNVVMNFSPTVVFEQPNAVYAGVLFGGVIKNPPTESNGFGSIFGLFDFANIRADTQSITCDQYASMAANPQFNRVNSGTLAVTTAYGFVYSPGVNTGTSITTGIGVSIQDGTGGGTITTQYGVDISSLTKGSTNIAIRTQGTTPSQYGGAFEFGATDRTISSLTPYQYIDSTITLGSVVEAPILDLKPTFVQGINGSGGGTQFGYVGVLNRPTIKNTAASAFNLDIISAYYDTPTVEADTQTITCTGVLTFNSAPTLTVVNAGVLTVSNLYSFFSQASINPGVTVTTRRGLSVSNFQGSGAVTTQTGVFIASLSGATNNFAIETAGTTNSRFGGKLQLGSQAVVPTGMLDIINIAATDVSLLVTGAAAQSSNYFTFQSSALVEQASLSSVGTLNLLGNITFTKELAHTISINSSTTSGAAGGALSISAGSATSGNANGGALTLTSGAGNSLGASGALTLQTGGGGGVAPGNVLIQSQSVFTSGTVTMRSGDTTGVNNSGTVTINSGSVATGTAGNLVLTAGGASGAGVGGNVTITSGNTVGGTNGTITLVSGGATSLTSTTTSHIAIANKLKVGGSTSPTEQVEIFAASSTTKGCIIRTAASATAAALEIENSAGDNRVSCFTSVSAATSPVFQYFTDGVTIAANVGSYVHLLSSTIETGSASGFQFASVTSTFNVNGVLGGFGSGLSMINFSPTINFKNGSSGTLGLPVFLNSEDIFADGITNMTFSGTFASFQDVPTLGIKNSGSFVAGAAYTAFGSGFTVSSGTIAERFCYYVADATGAGTLTTQYGLYIDDLTKGTNNHPILIAGTTGNSRHQPKIKFGANSAPGVDVDIAGGYATGKATVSLTADNQTVTTANRSYISLSSDNATAGNRTFILAQSTVAGHQLILEWTGTNAGELIDDSAQGTAGNHRMAGTWTPTQYDTISFISNGTDWVETSRSTN